MLARLRTVIHTSLRRQRGLSLVEQLAMLGAAAAVSVSMIATVNSMETNAKDKKTAAYQMELARASAEILENKIGFNSDSIVFFTLEYMQARFGLGVDLPTRNAYLQTPCLILKKNNIEERSGIFSIKTKPLIVGLLVTEGGDEIPEANLATIVGQAGRGTGYLSETDKGKKFIKFRLSDTADNPTVDLDQFKASAADEDIPKCSDKAAGKGHLATPIYWDGKKMTANYLYRMRVSDDKPYANQNVMRTDLNMGDDKDKYKIKNIKSIETKYLSFSKPVNAGDQCVGNVDATNSSNNTMTEVVMNYLGVNSLQPMNLENSLGVESDGLHRLLICKNGIWTVARDVPPVSEIRMASCDNPESDKSCDTYCNADEEFYSAHVWCYDADTKPRSDYIYGGTTDVPKTFITAPFFGDVHVGQVDTYVDNNKQTIEGFKTVCAHKKGIVLALWCKKKIK